MRGSEENNGPSRDVLFRHRVESDALDLGLCKERLGLRVSSQPWRGSVQREDKPLRMSSVCSHRRKGREADDGQRWSPPTAVELPNETTMVLTQAGSFPSHCSTSKIRQRVSLKVGDFGESDPHLSPPASPQRASLPLSSYFFLEQPRSDAPWTFETCIERRPRWLARPYVLISIDPGRGGGRARKSVWTAQEKPDTSRRSAPAAPSQPGPGRRESPSMKRTCHT